MVQNPKNLRVYGQAFMLSADVYNRFRDIKTSLRLKDQLFGSVSSVCANLAEMGAFESKTQQKQKLITCVGECNEAEYWFDLCREVGLLGEKEHGEFTGKLRKVRVMLFNLLGSVKEDIGKEGRKA
ncbi:MAG: four helix bundle protein [Candidatus Micrarchaeota archaeon]